MLAVINEVINTALSFKGTPYQWGGSTKQGMDCSGLIVESFKAAGVQMPRVAGEQAKTGPNIYLDQLQPGDLVFFSDKPGNKTITHVGLVVRTNYPIGSVTFLHASSSKYGVMESELLSFYWQGVFLTAVRPQAFLS